MILFKLGFKAAFLALMALAIYGPAFANTHDHHEHHQTADAVSDVASVEEVPSNATASKEDAEHCKLHVGKTCTCPATERALMTCNMSGCCIKDGSALPATLNDSAFGGNPSALVARVEFPGHATFRGLAPLEGFMESQVDLSPIPRPPA